MAQNQVLSFTKINSDCFLKKKEFLFIVSENYKLGDGHLGLKEHFL